MQAESTRALAELGSGDGPLSVRVRPSSLKHDCDRRTTSTRETCLVNVHAKSRLTPEPMRTLRSETRGQAGAGNGNVVEPSPVRCGPSRASPVPSRCPEPPSTADDRH
jgi:hypothetical protein